MRLSVTRLECTIEKCSREAYVEPRRARVEVSIFPKSDAGNVPEFRVDIGTRTTRVRLSWDVAPPWRSCSNRQREILATRERERERERLDSRTEDSHISAGYSGWHGIFSLFGGVSIFVGPRLSREREREKDPHHTAAIPSSLVLTSDCWKKWFDISGRRRPPYRSQLQVIDGVLRACEREPRRACVSPVRFRTRSGRIECEISQDTRFIARDIDHESETVSPMLKIQRNSTKVIGQDTRRRTLRASRKAPVTNHSGIWDLALLKL